MSRRTWLFLFFILFWAALIVKKDLFSSQTICISQSKPPHDCKTTSLRFLKYNSGNTLVNWWQNEENLSTIFSRFT